MNRDAWSFTGNNNTKSCRSPVLLIHKSGLQERHTFQKRLVKNSTAPVIIIVDSILAAGFRTYGRAWRNYFKDPLNLVIKDDCVENVLRRARDISLPHKIWLVIMHCRTNNRF